MDAKDSNLFWYTELLIDFQKFLSFCFWVWIFPSPLDCPKRILLFPVLGLWWTLIFQLSLVMAVMTFEWDALIIQVLNMLLCPWYSKDTFSDQFAQVNIYTDPCILRYMIRQISMSIIKIWHILNFSFKFIRFDKFYWQIESHQIATNRWVI